MAIEFDATVYKNGRGFNIPKASCDELGVGSNDEIHLTIESLSGDPLFDDDTVLTSGTEVTRKQVWSKLQPNLKIRGRISRAGTSAIEVETFPTEEDAANLSEGARTRVLVNRFERRRKYRKQCIQAHGTACCVCGFDFNKKYGAIGHGFIHVHHLTPVSQVGKSHTIDPVKDLRPVCPNCHEMLHQRKIPFSIEELRHIIRESNQSAHLGKC